MITLYYFIIVNKSNQAFVLAGLLLGAYHCCHEGRDRNFQDK
jgi:hypothetical protein